MFLPKVLLISATLSLVCIAGCARQASAPETPPGSSASATPTPPNPAGSFAPQFQPANYTAEGRIRQLNYAEDGRVDGFLLDNGTLIYLPANFSGAIPPLRTRVQVSGSLHPSVSERTVVTAQLVVPTTGSRPGTVTASASAVPPANNVAIAPPPPPPPSDAAVAPPPPPPAPGRRRSPPPPPTR